MRSMVRCIRIEFIFLTLIHVDFGLSGLTGQEACFNYKTRLYQKMKNVCDGYVICHNLIISPPLTLKGLYHARLEVGPFLHIDNGQDNDDGDNGRGRARWQSVP